MRAWWSRQDDRRKVVIGIAAVVLVMWAVTLTRGSASTRPANVVPAAAGPQSQYGGSAAVYAEIAATSDCEALQVMFDTAGDNNDLAEPGTDAHRWTTGYMLAADARMETVGCY